MKATDMTPESGKFPESEHFFGNSSVSGKKLIFGKVNSSGNSSASRIGSDSASNRFPKRDPFLENDRFPESSQKTFQS